MYDMSKNNAIMFLCSNLNPHASPKKTTSTSEIRTLTQDKKKSNNTKISEIKKTRPSNNIPFWSLLDNCN